MNNAAILLPQYLQNHFQNKRVLILGLGQSGLSMARWCARLGAEVVVQDTRDTPPCLDALREWVPEAEFLCAQPDAQLLEGRDVGAIFVSPGLTPSSYQSLREVAVAQGLWFGGELSLFVAALDFLRAQKQYDPKVLAITGTNGKTTVTTLTGLLAERAGKSVRIAGNIGPTLLDTLSQALHDDTLPEFWVLELSSFQLQWPCGFNPSAAVILNITQDHLDWHHDMREYAKAKGHIFGKDTVMILNRDDAQVMRFKPEEVSASSVLATQKPSNKKMPLSDESSDSVRWCGFGEGLPNRVGDFGLEDTAGMTWLVRAYLEEMDEGKRTKRNIKPALVEEGEIFLQKLMPVDALRIQGRHNAMNALAALALCMEAGCAMAPMLYGLREYRGEVHRVQSVGIVNGVEYIDDSKGTNVGATIAAVKGLGVQRKIVLIAGGDGKGQDFSPLKMPVKQFVKAVVLIGRDALLIRSALEQTGVLLHNCESMSDAVSVAADLSKAGDVVLLSPACASWDMWNGYGERAKAFIDAVSDVALEQGSALDGASS